MKTGKECEALKLTLPAYPRNGDEWWAFVEAWQWELEAILCRYAPAEAAGFDKAVEMRLHSLVAKALDKAWWKAPDHISIHSIPGWGVLCDLCSEYDPEWYK